MNTPRWVQDGVELELYRRADGVRLQLVRGRHDLPDLRRNVTHVPYRPGILPEPGIAGSRLLEVRGTVEKLTEAALEEELAAIMARFDPEALEPGLLVDPRADGVTRFTPAEVRNSAVTVIAPGARRLSIELETIDPWWYSAYGTLAMDSGVDMDGDLTMDSGGELVVTPPATDVTFNAVGNAPVSRLRVVFEGPATGPVGIENLSIPDVGFITDRTPLAGESYVFNNYHRHAHAYFGGTYGGNARSGVTLLEGNRHGEYLRLRPGSNTLRISGAPAEARVMFFPTWR